MWAKLREMFGRDVITCATWLVESQNCARIVSDYSDLPSFSFCLVLEDIKNLGLAEALQLIVNHGLAHDLIYITLGTLDALCLDEVVDIGTLLLILLFINGEESQTSLEPKIIFINIREENLVVVGWVDVCNLELA